MTAPLDALFVLLILTSFLLLGSSRLGACIRFVALQGVLAGLLPLAMAGGAVTLRAAATGAAVIGLKGFVFPFLLRRALRESDTSREVLPFVGYAASLIIGVLGILACFWIDGRLDLPMHSVSNMIVPVPLFMVMTGLFLIVARRTAVNQVIGYLVLENGIYAFGMAIVRDIPALIEMGVLMDVFVAVFVMGIAIYRINREFDHIDIDRLNTLTG
jgi:hydrogenase-4 component E